MIRGFLQLVLISVGILVEFVNIIQGDQCIQCAEIPVLRHSTCSKAALKDCPSTSAGGCAIFVGNLDTTHLSAQGVTFKYCTHYSTITCRNITSYTEEVTELQQAIGVVISDASITANLTIVDAEGKVCIHPSDISGVIDSALKTVPVSSTHPSVISVSIVKTVPVPSPSLSVTSSSAVRTTSAEKTLPQNKVKNAAQSSNANYPIFILAILATAVLC